MSCVVPYVSGWCAFVAYIRGVCFVCVCALFVLFVYACMLVCVCMLVCFSYACVVVCRMHVL